MKALAATVVLACSFTAAASADVTTVTFDNGWEGWHGTGATLVGAGGNPGAHAHTQIINFGVEYWTDSHAAFLGDYTQYSSVTISVDVKVNEINFFGTPVPRNLILDLRNLDLAQDGYLYSSVWFNLSEVEGGMDWATYSVTFDPNSPVMPAGWGGTGAEDPDTFMPMLPAHLTFADVMANIGQVSISTYEPGFFYSLNTYFDLQVDNIRIETTPIPAPGAGLALLGLAAVGRRRRR